MRYCMVVLLLLISFPVSGQIACAQDASQAQSPLIRNITIEGFVLGDKNQFVQLFKPYRNKHLSAADIDTLLQQLQRIYELGGYQGLVSIEYHVKKNNLTFTISLIE